MAYRFFVICLVLSLCSSPSLSADDFLSIDCGGSSLPYVDDYGITWVGDDTYIQSGESFSVKPENSVADHVGDTLRAFTTRTTNCYHITSVKQGRVLVRATFNYGNYDGKNSPPTFAIHFDGNDWVNEVNTSGYYYYEVTYVMRRDSISVCLSQTEPEQFPFITALEIRSLGINVYRYTANSYPLFLYRRVAYGTNTTIRYKDDIYDRYWGPGPFGNGSIRVSSDALFSKGISLDDSPPTAVLKNAITATRPNSSIDLLMGFPFYEMKAYINWYFSEVTKLQPNQTRSFRIMMDNELVYDQISPPYDGCFEIYYNSVQVSSTNTFSLVPTNISTLPPLINAMEIFQIGDSPLTDGTNKKDVQGLASLQDSFEVLQGWSSDPCLPAAYTWNWIKCNDNPIPRVTTLSLSSHGLSGLLPDLSSMDALETINLQNNSLRGPIPDFLGTLPNLKILNLQNNQFNGRIPNSLLTKNGLILMVAGNPNLCVSNTSLSCQIPATAPPPPKNSATKKKKNNILDLLLATMIPAMMIL